MTVVDLDADELVAMVLSGTFAAPGDIALGTVFRVSLDAGVDGGWPPPPLDLAGFGAVIVGTTGAGAAPREAPGAGWCDVVVEGPGDDLDRIIESAERSPVAATSLAQVLRGADRRPFEDAMLLESAVYSALQAGPEFARWRVGRPPPVEPDHGEVAVDVMRQDGGIVVTLTRPRVHNALNTVMRDQLIEALALVRADPTIRSVVIEGAGPSFCSGGDLAEFGSFSDPATAHLVRQQYNIARMLHAVVDRCEARLHGACFGSGIELPALANRVVARADTRICLPELGLGLIPGAGGTWSIPQRIGRHRTALLALTAQPIDAATALDWGLVDAIDTDRL